MRLNAHEKNEKRQQAAECNFQRAVIRESYVEGGFEVDKEITIHCEDRKMFSNVSLLKGTIVKMTEKAILVRSSREIVWFPKSALKIVRGPEGEVYCWLAKWFRLSPNQSLLFTR